MRHGGAEKERERVCVCEEPTFLNEVQLKKMKKPWEKQGTLCRDVCLSCLAFPKAFSFSSARLCQKWASALLAFPL